MKDILADLDRWGGAGEWLAIATLVRVQGSAPRLPGARLLVTASGRMAGSVSGGCVENDIVERAQQVVQSEESVLATYGIVDETSPDVGLPCGTIDVLIQPFAPSAAWQAVRGALERGEAAALATSLAPSTLGRALAVGAVAVTGSIDPTLDAAIATEARGALERGETRRIAVPCADGEVDVFVESFARSPRLFIVGATHTAMPLSRLARELGFHVTVIDPRRAYASPERFPLVDALVCEWPVPALGDALDPSDYVVTMSHDPKLDVPALACALRAGVRYVGAMGSRQTHERRKAALREEGFGEADLGRIHAPVGLALGGRAPEEIALAIVAEMVAVRCGREPGVAAR
jgi:xanthine dehydrogenase accessory factor